MGMPMIMLCHFLQCNPNLCNLHTCYIFISSSLSHNPLSEKDLESLGWDDLSAQKRQLTSELKKLSQSKNFLSVMEARLPPEKEEDLQAIVQKNQAIIDAKDYKSEREKNEILSRIKDAAMKLEASKATRTIREQFSQLTQESANINNAIKQLIEERNVLRNKISNINVALDNLYESKRRLASEHQSYLIRYDGIAKQFDAINARLDSMSEMRRKQRKEYGYVEHRDALFKVK